MRRYHVTLGAYTTAGGVVVSASSTSAINDKRVPLEGDKIACPSCKSPGYIVCTGPRIPEFEGSKPLALEGDFCICGCVPPPRLIANQSLSFHTIEGRSEPAHVQAYDKVTKDNGKYDQFFHLTDEVTGRPLTNRFYRMTFDGKTIEGKTDGEGRTQKVEADHAAEVEIEVFPEGYDGSVL